MFRKMKCHAQCSFALSLRPAPFLSNPKSWTAVCAGTCKVMTSGKFPCPGASKSRRLPPNAASKKFDNSDWAAMALFARANCKSFSSLSALSLMAKDCSRQCDMQVLIWLCKLSATEFAGDSSVWGASVMTIFRNLRGSRPLLRASESSFPNSTRSFHLLPPCDFKSVYFMAAALKSILLLCPGTNFPEYSRWRNARQGPPNPPRPFWRLLPFLTLGGFFFFWSPFLLWCVPASWRSKPSDSQTCCRTVHSAESWLNCNAQVWVDLTWTNLLVAECLASIVRMSTCATSAKLDNMAMLLLLTISSNVGNWPTKVCIKPSCMHSGVSNTSATFPQRMPNNLYGQHLWTSTTNVSTLEPALLSKRKQSAWNESLSARTGKCSGAVWNMWRKVWKNLWVCFPIKSSRILKDRFSPLIDALFWVASHFFELRKI